MNGTVILGIVLAVGVFIFLNHSAPSTNPPPIVENNAASFGGYVCTVDCSGHEAGYEWAEEHDINDEDDCDTAGDRSNSPSFAEGCKAFVNGEGAPSSDGDEEDNDSENE